MAMIPAMEPAAIQGLTEREVQARRAAGQGNRAPPPTGRTYAQIVRENVFTFINTILFLLSLALVLVGRPLDALVSVGVIAMNIAVSVVQEVRAKRTLDRIALLTRPRVTVIRDGQEGAVGPEELVLDDVLAAGPGDQIALDGRLLDGRMQVDESQLTGESDLIPKGAGDAVYSGSFCVSGRGRYTVEKVGTASLANEITAGARSFRRVLTPLQRHIYLVIRIVLLIVIYLQLLLATHAVLTLVPLADAIGQATILASLIPNGLFLSIAIAYALGAVRIARFGALVQQSNAIESLSHVDVLCLDKTGTLTANRLQVSALLPLGTTDEELRHILGTVATSAPTTNKTSAVIALAYPAVPWRVVAEVPFSSARKWSAVALDDPHPGAEGGSGRPLRGIYALGAPEFLHPYLAPATSPGTTGWPEITAHAGDWAARGLRVLLVAHHPDPELLEDRGDDARLPAGLVPLGLVGLSDELRPEAGATLAAFITAGVAPKIISGDNSETVAALARQAGLGPDIGLVSGLELERMDAPAFAQAANDATIFGRITPRQKEHLVAALHAQGHYVAMIGDGINDVLALKTADLAIALQSGTQAARAVADIVLLNDSFAALAPTVREGQRILNGMQHILKLFLARISTIGLVIPGALVIGLFPIALRNGSVVTFLTVGIPSVLLAVWARPAARPTTRAAVRPTRGLVRDLLTFVGPVAVLSSLLGLVVFYGALALRLWELGELGLIASPKIALLRQDIASSLPLAQTALTAFLVYCGLFLVIFVEPPTRWWAGHAEPSGDIKPTAMAVSLMLAFVIIARVPPLRRLFALAPLELSTWLLIAAVLGVWLALIRLFWRKQLLGRFLGEHDAA
jgi:cation-transporting P-type ATPase E